MRAPAQLLSQNVPAAWRDEAGLFDLRRRAAAGQRRRRRLLALARTVAARLRPRLRRADRLPVSHYPHRVGGLA